MLSLQTIVLKAKVPARLIYFVLQVSIIPTRSKEFNNKSKEISLEYPHVPFVFVRMTYILKFPKKRSFLL